MLENISDHVSMIDSAGNLLFESPSIAKTLGQDSANAGLIGLHLHGAKIHARDRQATLQAFQTVLRTGESVTVRYRLLLPASGTAWYEAEAKLVDLPGSGADRGLMVVARDITHLVHSEERFRILAENASDLITLVSPDGTRIYESPSFERVLGSQYTRDREFGHYIHPDDRDKVMAAFSDAFAQHKSISQTYRLRYGSDQWRWFETRADPILDEDGNLQSVLYSGRDVTESREKQRDLAEREALYSALVNNSPDLITLYDRDGNILYDSPSWKREFGEDVLRARQRGDLVYPDDREKARSTFEKILNHGGTVNLEFRLVKPDGNIVWVEGIAVAIAGPDGRTDRVLAFHRDINRRHQMQQQLAQSEERYRLLAENAQDFIQLFDLDGETIYDSPSFVRAAGKQYKAARKVGSFVHPDDQKRVNLALRNLRATGEPTHLVARFQFGPDDIRWVQATGSLVRTEEGKPDLILVVSHDITQLRHAEEQLRQTQKLEAVGQLTGGLAHDFNNLLGIVIGNLDWLRDHLPDDPKVERRFLSALQAAERGAEVTRSLLAVARRQPLELAEHDLNALIVEMLPLLKSSAGAAITIRSGLVAGKLEASIDVSGLSNVLLNLVINARDAMADVARDKLLLIRTRREFLAGSAAGDLTPGWYASIEVTDNGSGMNDQVLQQAFEPFFTTKERGRGTGLGLAMVRGYAEQLGGTARIRSVENEGTTVELLLPLDQTEAAVRDQQEQIRLRALASTGLLDSEPEPAFDQLADEAAAISDMPMAVVAMLDASRMWFKATHAMPGSWIPKEISFCSHVIEGRGSTLLVPDAELDPRFSGNRLVVGAPGIRAYAGVPLTDPSGQPIGTLCVIDTEPRTLSDEQLAGLEQLGMRANQLIANSTLPMNEPVNTGHAPSPASQTHSCRALVVDDEEALCDIGCAWLESLGFEVVGVNSSAEAIEMLGKEKFDLLFTDMILPGGLDGMQIVAKARELHPQIRVILAGGNLSHVFETDESMPGPSLGKPYRKADIAKALAVLGFGAQH